MHEKKDELKMHELNEKRHLTQYLTNEYNEHSINGSYFEGCNQ